MISRLRAANRDGSNLPIVVGTGHMGTTTSAVCRRQPKQGRLTRTITTAMAIDGTKMGLSLSPRALVAATTARIPAMDLSTTLRAT